MQDPVGTDSEGKEISLMDKICSDSEDVFCEVETKMRIKDLYEKMGFDRIAENRFEADVDRFQYHKTFITEE